MAAKIELKGLSATVQRARDAIANARRASTDLETEAGSFASDADEITSQIKAHHDDLLFDATQLGNSQGQSTQQGNGAVAANAGSSLPKAGNIEPPAAVAGAANPPAFQQ